MIESRQHTGTDVSPAGGTVRACSRCVMDTTDPDIRFDDQGVCNHCHEYDEAIRLLILPPHEAEKKLNQIVEKIRKEGRRKKYDCVIGVSGGVDSSFIAYKVKELGLRPLAVHLDNGWDSELAVANIHKLLEILKIDLHTHVIDWEEFRDLQLSFLKASTPDSEIPSDHAIVAIMNKTASKIGVRYVITGHNIRTESHLPPAWSQGHFDWRYVRSVHKQFGTLPLKTFPHLDLVAYFRHIFILRWINLLNYLDYNKEDAMKMLQEKFCWKYYGGKHWESIYTRFYQAYILPS
ncbi:N-acetyl sugar amidotransferase, partial [bacterium]|nr:N-acetyl sugar amidotransferase [bacterium]